MNWWASLWIIKKMELAKICNMLLKRWNFDDFRVHGLGNCPSISSRNWLSDLEYVSFPLCIAVSTFVRLPSWMFFKISSSSLFVICKSFLYTVLNFFLPPETSVVQPACFAGPESRHRQQCGQCDTAITWALAPPSFVGSTVTYRASWPQEMMCFHNQTHLKAIKSKFNDKALYYFCQGWGQWVNISCSVDTKNK